jgi:hypothetical protein
MDIISYREAKNIGLKLYFTGKPCRSGNHVCEKFVVGGCVECFKISTKKWRNENKDRINLEKKEDYKIKTREVSEKRRIMRLLDREALLIHNAKSRAKKNGIEFDINISDIIIPEVCPYFGIPLFVNQGKCGPCDNSPTLDRIDSSKGYVKGNVEVISMRANTIKNSGTSEEHLIIGNRMNKIQGIVVQ